MMLNATLLKKSSLQKLYFGLTLFALFGLNACKKEEVDNNTYGAISVVNASPTVSTYDIYVGDGKANSAALPFGGTINYTQKVTGNYDVKFTVPGRVESVYTKAITIPQNVFQTFFLTGKTGSFDGFLVTDDHFDVSANNAFIRFVNVSPDAPALDLFVKGGSLVVANKAFKTASTFQNIPIGTYTFEIKQNSNGTVKITTESITLGATGYYTVMVRGLVTPSTNGLEQPLSAQFILSK